jgi:hypothetical protein
MRHTQKLKLIYEIKEYFNTRDSESFSFLNPRYSN